MIKFENIEFAKYECSIALDQKAFAQLFRKIVSR